MVKKLNLFISLILVIAVKGEDVETAVSTSSPLTAITKIKLMKRFNFLTMITLADDVF